MYHQARDQVGAMLHARLLRYLDEVARCGSIRKAAAKLNVASSAVNRQLIAFEQDLGTPVFERLPRRLRLTAAGEILIAHIRSTLKDYQASLEQIDTLRDVRQPSVTIATVGGLAGDMLAATLVEFRRDRPFSRFSISILDAEAIPASVAAGDHDVGFAFDMKDLAAVSVAASLRSRFGAVMPPAHPLAACEILRLEALRGHPMIMPHTGVVIRDHFDAAAARLHLTFRPTFESNSFELLKHLALLGQGVALLNEIDVGEARRLGAAAFVPIAELGHLTQTLSVVHRARGSLGPLTGLVVDHLSHALKRHAGSD